jgi:hypothetical protein
LRKSSAVLSRIRSEVYEDLNQIQHEYLILRAAEWLIAQGVCPATTQWTWNPRQSGDANEPDLEGKVNGQIVLSAEITASADPQGAIGARMQTTLKKLSTFQGKLFYFVRTESMRRRAETNVTKAGRQIGVVMLPT